MQVFIELMIFIKNCMDENQKPPKTLPSLNLFPHFCKALLFKCAVG